MSIWRRALDWWEIPAIGTLAAVVVALAVYVHGLNQTLPEEIGGEAPVEIVPATGVEGFKVAEFCADELTHVAGMVAPDASGVTFELHRVREGVEETVRVIVMDAKATGTHYYDGPDGQRSQPAYVDDEAMACILEKAP